MTTSPTVSYPWAMTTLRASFSTTSWPGRSLSSSTAGLTLTRIFRPPVNTSAVPSSQASRNTPKPDGGWASRSNFLLERHDLVACLAQRIGQPLILAGDRGQAGLGLTQALLEKPGMPGRVSQPAPQHCHLLLEEGDLRGEALNLVFARGARSFIASGHAPTPFREQTSLRPYLSEALA